MSTTTAVELKFQEFLQYCRQQQLTNSQMRVLLKPLQGIKQPKRYTTICGILSVSIAVGLLCYWYANWLSWAFSAVGRLALIQLLPYWDWSKLYNSKCLLERSTGREQSASKPPALGKFETMAENCMLCETFTDLPTLRNVSYAYLESAYLERGWPVIVQDSHASKSLPMLLHDLEVMPSTFLQSEPCDLATNLMLPKLFTIPAALQKITTLSSSTAWFLQLRNCASAAVRASRAFVTRPYYYPQHLEPFYSSWLLMSHNHVTYKLKELYLHGLIIVQQLHGSFLINLKPKQPCDKVCPLVTLRLLEGEALIFSTDLWIFRYGSDEIDAAEPAIATILEIDWFV